MECQLAVVKKKQKQKKTKNESYRIINLITSIRLQVEYEATKFVSLHDMKIKNKIRKTNKTDWLPRNFSRKTRYWRDSPENTGTEYKNGNEKLIRKQCLPMKFVLIL